MAACGTRSAVVVFSASFDVVVWAPAVCAEDSFLTAFDSHVALFSTSEACRTISVVQRVWRVIVKTAMTGGSGCV